MKRNIILVLFCFVVHISYSQSILDSISYDYPGFYNAYLKKIIATNDFGYFGIINTMKFNGSNYDFGFIVVKFNYNLDTVWSKYLYFGEDFCYDVIQTEDDGYILAGQSFGDFFISKLNSSGEILFDTIIQSSYGYAESISMASDSNYLISGCRGYQGFIQKIDKDCNMLCSLYLPSSTVYTSILYNSYNYIVSTGHENNYYFLRLFKINSVLDTIWTKKLHFQGDTVWSVPKQIIHTVDNEFIIGGYQDHPNPNPDNSFIIKTDSIGNVIWDNNFDNKHFVLESIIQTNSGGYLIGFCGGESTNLILYSKEFFPLWEGFSDDIYSIIKKDKFTYLLAANTCTLINISDNFQSIEENHIGKIINMQVTPNPAESQIILYFTLPYKSNFKCRINIYDVFGQLIDNIIQEGNNGENEYLLDVRNYSTGVYFVRLISDDLKGNCKFLVIHSF